jgi:hypothetical protein
VDIKHLRDLFAILANIRPWGALALVALSLADTLAGAQGTTQDRCHDLEMRVHLIPNKCQHYSMYVLGQAPLSRGLHPSVYELVCQAYSLVSKAPSLRPLFPRHLPSALFAAVSAVCQQEKKEGFLIICVLLSAACIAKSTSRLSGVFLGLQWGR